MKRTLPRYVSEYANQHGKFQLRFRRKGQATYYFKSKAGSEAFYQEYASCLAGESAPRVQPGADRAAHGSIDDACERFYRSPGWKGMTKESSRKTYRGIIERFRERRTSKGQRFGSLPISGIKVQHLDAIFGDMAETPAAANNLRKILKRIFAYAVKVEMRADNPVLLTDGFKNKGTGFHTWTEDEIEQFQARHPIGTKARLALELMLWTGQRGRSDVTRFGRQHIENGRIRLRQVKTSTPQFIKVSRQLRAAIDAMPSDNMTFLVTEFGKPWTPAGFGNWFRDRCDEAGLPQCSAHGLRKAMSRRLAELGASHSEGKAVTGHKTDREFSRYAAEADQVRLADSAIDRLSREKMANRKTGLAKISSKPLKRKD